MPLLLLLTAVWPAQYVRHRQPIVAALKGLLVGLPQRGCVQQGRGAYFRELAAFSPGMQQQALLGSPASAAVLPSMASPQACIPGEPPHLRPRAPLPCRAVWAAFVGSLLPNHFTGTLGAAISGCTGGSASAGTQTLRAGVGLTAQLALHALGEGVDGRGAACWP